MFRLQLLATVATLVCLASQAKADLVVSNSATDALAGSTITLTVGEIGSLHVWASTESGQRLRGISFNLTTDSPGFVAAQSQTLSPALLGWVGNPTLGTDPLVAGGGGVDFRFPQQSGVGSTPENPFFLVSSIDLLAEDFGTANVQLELGNAGILTESGVLSGDALANFSFGGGTVTAVPEPGMLAFLGLVGSSATAIRWRRRQRVARVG